MSARRITRIETSVDAGRGVYVISVAAELAEMHPQTLRVYESRGLINPQRSPKNTRLYSQRDVELLQRIQELTAEGLNLAGVEMVLALERRIEGLEAELEKAKQQASKSQDGTTKKGRR